MAQVRLHHTNAFTLAGLTLLRASATGHAQQFVLFDATFTVTKEDADNFKPGKSHYYVRDKALNAERPKDWTSPVDYRNGTVHIRIEVLEKPAGRRTHHLGAVLHPEQGAEERVRLHWHRGVVRKRAFTSGT